MMRTNKLPRPRLQLKIIGVFLAVALFALVLHGILVTHTIATVAAEIPNDGALVLAELRGTVGSNLLSSILVLVPLMVSLAMLVTFRIAGPVHRLEDHLRRVIAGESPPPCRLRRDDELQELCALVNAATGAEEAPASPAPSERAA